MSKSGKQKKVDLGKSPEDEDNPANRTSGSRTAAAINVSEGRNTSSRGAATLIRRQRLGTPTLSVPIVPKSTKPLSRFAPSTSGDLPQPRRKSAAKGTTPLASKSSVRRESAPPLSSSTIKLTSRNVKSSGGSPSRTESSSGMAKTFSGPSTSTSQVNSTSSSIHSKPSGVSTPLRDESNRHNTGPRSTKASSLSLPAVNVDYGYEYGFGTIVKGNRQLESPASGISPPLRAESTRQSTRGSAMATTGPSPSQIKSTPSSSHSKPSYISTPPPYESNRPSPGSTKASSLSSPKQDVELNRSSTEGSPSGGSIHPSGAGTDPHSRVAYGYGEYGPYGFGTIVKGNRQLESREIKTSSSSRPNYSGLDAANAKLEARKKIQDGERCYQLGMFLKAVQYYDEAYSITSSVKSPHYHRSRSEALIGLKRFKEAVEECHKAYKLDERDVLTKSVYGSLLIRLGHIDLARERLKAVGKPEFDRKITAIKEQINSCASARSAANWKLTLLAAECAIESGADSSPELFACKTEAYLKQGKITEAEATFENLKFEIISPQPIFGMANDAYLLYVRAQVKYATGNFDDSIIAINSASKIDRSNPEILALSKIITPVVEARKAGHENYYLEKISQASKCYEEGLKSDPYNPFLHFNQAACYINLHNWDLALNACKQALQIRPNYEKARIRRAKCYAQLQIWEKAVEDYKVVLPGNPEALMEPYFKAQSEFRVSKGLDTTCMQLGREVELVKMKEILEYKLAKSPGNYAVVVLFFEARNTEYLAFFDKLCLLCPWIVFLKVDTQASQSLKMQESIEAVPTVKIYKKGEIKKLLVCPPQDMLERYVNLYCE